jgi:triosephosphate isomerase
MTRQKFFAGNWKLWGTQAEAKALIAAHDCGLINSEMSVTIRAWLHQNHQYAEIFQEALDAWAPPKMMNKKMIYIDDEKLMNI